MNVELIGKPRWNNVVLDNFSHKEEYNDKPLNKIQSLQMIFVGESNLEKK
jgi:hypothetical protein